MASHWSLVTALFAQQPQTNDVWKTQPLYPPNATYVQGVGPGYWPTAGNGLTLNLSAGTVFCGNRPAAAYYAGGALTMAPSTTNYVYLDPTAAGAPASNTTGFPVGYPAIAVVIAGGSAITGITDLRTWFVDPNTQGPTMRADLMPGANACAKIQNAINALPNYNGVVDARGIVTGLTCAGGISVNFGTGSTAVLELDLPPRIITTGATWSFTSDDGLGVVILKGTDGGDEDSAPTGGTSSTWMREGNGKNLPAVIKVNAAEVTLEGFGVDGNKANQTCPSPPCHGIWLYDSWRALVDRVHIISAYSNNFQLESSSLSSQYSSGARINVLDSWFAGGSAAQVKNTQDVQISNSSFESSNIGLELLDASNVRYFSNDYGGNTTYRFKSTCTSLRDGANGALVVGGQFGTNAQGSIFIDGWNGSASCNGGNLISGVQTPSSGLSADNTYSAIVLKDSGNNMVSGNTILYQNGQPNHFKYGIELRNTNSAEGPDTVTGNHITGSGTLACVILGNTTSIGNDTCPNQLPSSLVVSYTGSAALLTLYDSSNLKSNHILLGNQAGNDYQIGRVPATGFLDFNGNQTTNSGFHFNVTPTGTVLTLLNNGNVGIGTDTIATGQKLEVNGGIALNTTTAQPTCNSTTRGTFWVVQGAAGVKDNVQVCAKDASNTYAWRAIY